MSMTTEDIARVTHQANKILRIAFGEEPGPDWDEFPAESQQSVIEGVEKALAGATPEQLHESWLDFKREHGWIYGETKNEDVKTHPNLVPYGELPREQKVKDALFKQIIDALRDQHAPF